MYRPNLFALLVLFSGSILPGAISAQQPEEKPDESQLHTQNVPVQPERTPQQSERQRGNPAAEDTRINRDWTARHSDDERADMNRLQQRRMDAERDSRTVGQGARRPDEDLDRGSRYGSVYRGEGRTYEARPQRRVKTCFEYSNGEEFCRYLD